MKATDYDLLYDLPDGEYTGAGLDGVRTTTIRAGRSLEVICAPVFRVTQEARREVKRRRTTAAMEKINARTTELHRMRLLEYTFTPRAVVVTGTYAYPAEDYGLCNLDELADAYERRGLPWEPERVKRDVRNYRERIKRRVIQMGGKAGDLKWIICIEEGKAPPAEGLPPKYHFHGIFEGPGVTRELLEELWPHGMGKFEYFDTQEDGAKRLAHYLAKQRRAGRWWSHSRNLKEPPRTVSNRKVSRRRLTRIAEDVRKDGREILRELYPGFKPVEIVVKYSDFAPGAYIYARMRREEDTAPPWERIRTKPPRGGGK